MPETRYNEEYTYPDGLTPEEKIPANATINKIPYEVSDEQLDIEAAEKTIAELAALADSDLKVPQVGKFLKALAKLRR